MKDTSYNGWTNYATWRINLEIFDGSSLDAFTTDNNIDAYELSKQLKGTCEALLEESAPEGLALDYALAFAADVNFYEIAKHLLENEE